MLQHISVPQFFLLNNIPLVLLPGESHGWRSLVGCSPWVREESDTTERLHFHFSLSCIGEGNGNPLQCSCLENPRHSRAWWAAVYGVAQSQTQLKWLSSSSIWTYHISFTHLSVDGLLGCLYSGAIYCCYEHSYTSFCVDIYFYFIWMYT